MAWTVYGAFRDFREQIDLPEEVNESARVSIWSISSRIKELASGNEDFPTLSADPMLYGSYARKTKVLPLNDLDFLLPLQAEDVSVSSLPHDRFGFDVSTASGPLSRFTGTYSDTVYSSRVLDSIRDQLKGLRDLKLESVDRRLQTVRLKLTLYDWNFDLVPAIPLQRGGVISHYLIPNGNDAWWATDPRVDHALMNEAVIRHGAVFLSLMRLMKQWNACHRPHLGSYHLETLVRQVMQSEGTMYTTDLPELALRCFDRLRPAMFSACPDPKGLGPDLDLGMDWLRRTQAASNLSWAAYYADRAIEEESRGGNEEAIDYWQSAFGPTFPSYGGT